MNEQYNTAASIDTWERRRYRKPWGKIAVFLIIVGAALFAAGWASGARGGRVYFESGLRIETPPFNIPESLRAAHIDLSSNIHTVTVNATSCAIRIVPTSADRPQVVSSESRDMVVNEVSGRLYVDTRSADAWFIGGVNRNRRNWHIMNIGTFGVSWNRSGSTSFMDFNFDFDNFSLSNRTGNTITVYLPDSVQQIEARSTSGSVRLENISTTRLNLRSTSGSVNVDGGTHRNTRLQSTSGSVRGNGYFAGGIYARSTSGGVNIQDYSTAHRNTDSIHLQSTSGSVRFSTRAPISDFSYELSVTSGSVRIDGSSVSGRRVSGGTGNVPINARSTSGSIHLDFSR
ncbi:MAG: DUF4097 domain-containing protein [Firmicutes bacterium]|nr:DUF4097 domain-containing protein [Bacillota bacterium]